MNVKTDSSRPSTLFRRAFSLVEVLAAITIIGIITFLAIPNLVRIKEDGERSLAISRAEAMNMALAAFVQHYGQANAVVEWDKASDNAARYALVKPYLAFSPAAVADYMPGGYSVTLPTDIDPIQKVGLAGPDGAVSGYGQ